MVGIYFEAHPGLAAVALNVRQLTTLGNLCSFISVLEKMMVLSWNKMIRVK